jgi:ATP-binding cassette subfamily B protein
MALRSPQSFRERLGTFRHLPPFLRLVWDSSPALTLLSLTLRLVRAVVPVLVLYVGKLIVDLVVAENRVSHAGLSTAEWIESAGLIRAVYLVGLEFGLAVVADFSGRFSALVDSLLSEKYSNFASIRLTTASAYGGGNASLRYSLSCLRRRDRRLEYLDCASVLPLSRP